MFLVPAVAGFYKPNIPRPENWGKGLTRFWRDIWAYWSGRATLFGKSSHTDEEIESMPNHNSKPPKRPRGRPRTHPMPDPIPDTPENVARILMSTPPPKESEWKYLKDAPPTGPYTRR